MTLSNQIKSRKTKRCIIMCHPPNDNFCRGVHKRTDPRRFPPRNTWSCHCATFKRLNLCQRKASPHCGARFFARESGWPGIYANDGVVQAGKECDRIPPLSFASLLLLSPAVDWRDDQISLCNQRLFLSNTSDLTVPPHPPNHAPPPVSRFNVA